MTTCNDRITVNEIVYGDEIAGDEVPCGLPANLMIDPELMEPGATPHYVCGAHARWHAGHLILAPR